LLLVVSCEGFSVLDANNHQGKFGQDYVRVLASAAGLLVYTPDLDYDGVDFLIRWPGKVGAAASPAIDVQIKSWSRPKNTDGYLHFNGLNELQFNKLAGSDYTVPRYLFLVTVPPNKETYSEILTDGMLLRYQGYYLSLRDEAPIENPSKDRRRSVRVPLGNILTVRTLRALLQSELGPSGSAR
jgi:Domain of unknown function (DUF4365)